MHLKFFTFGGHRFHLLGYPGIRSPTVAPETPGDSGRTAWRVFLISLKLICRRVRASAPDGCSPRAPEPPGDSSRVARGVVSAPSRVRLKDLIFHQLGVFPSGSWRPVYWGLIRGRPHWCFCPWWRIVRGFLLSWAGRRVAGPLGGPKRKETDLCGLCFPGGWRVRIRLGKADRPPRFFWDERIGTARACPAT